MLNWPITGLLYIYIYIYLKCATLLLLSEVRPVARYSSLGQIATSASYCRVRFCTGLTLPFSYRATPSRYFQVLDLHFVGIDVYSNKEVFRSLLSLCTNVITLTVWTVHVSACNVAQAPYYCLNANVHISFLFYHVK
jgi:hypothetical protein